VNPTLKSISLTVNVKEWLENSQQPKILHIFDDVCNLINEEKEVLSIVNSEIGNGPFNLVVEEPVLFTRHLDTESKVIIQETKILIGDLEIQSAYAQMWNPIPNWEGLRKNRNEIVSRLVLLRFDQDNETIAPFADSFVNALVETNIPKIKEGTSKLAGLGIGLTPAGDDFLMGAMHAAWIIYPQDIAKNITSEIANIATPLTTSLSGAWLRSAAKGEAGELWNDLFDTLIKDENMYLPMSKILSVGETSGSDALSGFLGVLSAFK